MPVLHLWCCLSYDDLRRDLLPSSYKELRLLIDLALWQCDRAPKSACTFLTGSSNAIPTDKLMRTSWRKWETTFVQVYSSWLLWLQLLLHNNNMTPWTNTEQKHPLNIEEIWSLELQMPPKLMYSSKPNATKHPMNQPWLEATKIILVIGASPISKNKIGDGLWHWVYHMIQTHTHTYIYIYTVYIYIYIHIKSQSIPKCWWF